MNSIDRSLRNIQYKLKHSYSRYAANKPFKGKAGVRVLLYHRVSNECQMPMAVKLHSFNAQMAWLSKNTKCVQVSSINNAVEAPSDTVAITFDDGYKDNLFNAANILAKYNLTATLFISPYFVINQVAFPWDRCWRGNEVLTVHDLRELVESGIFKIENHTFSHPDLPALEKSEIITEIDDTNRWIECELGVKPDCFAYPKGLYDQRVVRVISERFSSAFTVESGINTSKTNKLKRPRVPIQNNDGINEFEAKVKGYFDWAAPFGGSGFIRRIARGWGIG